MKYLRINLIIKLLLIFCFINLFSIGLFSADLKSNWIQQYKGRSHSVISKTDRNGDILIVMTFSNQIAFSNQLMLKDYSDGTLLVTKLNNNGKIKWYKIINSIDSLSQILSKTLLFDSSNNIILNGLFQGSYRLKNDSLIATQYPYSSFVIKLDSNGNEINSQTLPSFINVNTQISTDNYFYVVGKYTDTIDFNNGIKFFSSLKYANKSFIAKFDNNWNIIWAHDLLDSAKEYTDICIDKYNNLYVTGSYRNKLFINDQITLNAIGKSDIFVMKIDTSGKYLWAASGGTEFTDNISKNILIDKNQNVILSGIVNFVDEPRQHSGKFGNRLFYSEGNSDIIIVRYDSNGVVNWLSLASSPLLKIFECMTLDAHDNLYLVGIYTDSININQNNYKPKKNINSRVAFISVFSRDTSLIDFQEIYNQGFLAFGSINYTNNSLILSGVHSGPVFIGEDSITSSYVNMEGYTFLSSITFPNFLSIENDRNFESVSNLIFPNPASDYIYLNKGLQPLVQNIEIYSTLSMKVMETEWQEKLDVSSLTPGVYFVKIGDKVQKFVKM